ncbi:MAG TPA: Flp pilus assembly protein CpaB [Patescibacteria group bacterium]|nr:Flp pilus assembly protein CpaB [Patescibacteria group bacterium]
MKRSNRLVLLVGVFLAVIAFVGIALLLGQPKGGDPGKSAIPTTLPTVIATRDIPLGVTITADMLTVAERKIDTERKTTAFTSAELVIGRVTRRPITNAAQLETADFDTSATGITRIDVPPTQRAMSIQVDQVSGVGTVINTGDYVDVIVGFTGDKFPVVTLNPTDDSITVVSGLNGTSVKLLIEGRQVLGRLLPPPAAAAQGEAAPPANPDGTSTSLTGQQEIVIVGVTAAQAEIIKFGQMDGSISLVLRSAKDFVDEFGNPIEAPPTGTEGVTLKKLTTDFAVPIPELVEAILPAQASARP